MLSPTRGPTTCCACVHYNQGSIFDRAVTISERSAEHGHTPFSYPTGTTWDQAQDRLEADRRWRTRPASS